MLLKFEYLEKIQDVWVDFSSHMYSIMRSRLSWFAFLLIISINLILGIKQFDLQSANNQQLNMAIYKAAQASMKMPQQESVRTDFTDDLPIEPATNALIQDGFKLGKAAGLTVVSAQPTNQSHADGQLSRVVVNFKVKGSYPAIKQVLAALLKKYPGLTLQHLNIRRGIESTAPLPQLVAPTMPGVPVVKIGPQQEAEISLIQWGKDNTLRKQALVQEKSIAP